MQLRLPQLFPQLGYRFTKSIRLNVPRFVPRFCIRYSLFETPGFWRLTVVNPTMN